MSGVKMCVAQCQNNEHHWCQTLDAVRFIITLSTQGVMQSVLSINAKIASSEDLPDYIRIVDDIITRNL